MSFYGSVSEKWKLSDFSITVDTACSSSTCYRLGVSIYKMGALDLVVADETCTPLFPGHNRWNKLNVLEKDNENPTKVPSPFSKRRKGTVLGEGAGAVIITKEEICEKFGLIPLAEVCGYGYSNDTTHLTHTNHKSIEKAIEKSFQDYPELFEKVNYIQAHGTGTPVNDFEETIAIKNMFKDKAYKLKVNSVKSMIGHTMGASGVISTIAAIIQMKENKLHPTINLDEPDPECDLDYVANESIDYEVNCALVNAFAFGGSNAVILLKNLN